MNRLYLALGFALLAQSGWGASICTSGSLSSYLALGSGGCSIGSATFDSFQVLSGVSDSSPIATDTILVTPGSTAGNLSLTFDFGVATTGIAEAIFTYRIFGSTFTASSVNLSQTAVSGTGVVAGIQNLCGNGTFGADGVSGCSGVTFGPLVALNSGSDQASFAGVSALSVTNDLLFDAGRSGSASGGTFVNQFSANAVSAVPEPGTLLVTACGAAMLLGFRKFAVKRSQSNKEIL